MPLYQTFGNATADAYGGGVTLRPTTIVDVFSGYPYTGNGTSQTITNNINLSTYGGMVWTKNRDTTYPHRVMDTTRGMSYQLDTASNSSQFNSYAYSANTDGYYIPSSDAAYNSSGHTYISWTFREQPKFFTQGTYTGNGSTQNIAHDLDSVPGCILVKDITNAGNWVVWHRGLSSGYYIQLNNSYPQSNFFAERNFGNNTTTVNPTSTQFTTGSLINSSGDTFVYYAFAHDAGGFGVTGTDNVISCGSFNAASGGSVNLGYQPQWILFRQADGYSNWYMYNSKTNKNLFADLNTAEGALSGMTFTSTGFDYAAFGGNWIYMVIRNG